jgi:hypothetical protein
VDGAANAEIVTKGRFAELRNVSPGRVSQWITEGKIRPDALVGDGRNAKINVTIATLQLRNSLDINQRAGNGLDTNLDLPLPAAAPTPTVSDPRREPDTPAPVVDPIEEGIKKERLEQLRRSNRKQAEEEAARSGRYTDAAEASRRMGQLGAQLMSVVEGSLMEISTAIGAKFQIPQRDVLHLLRSEFRKVRANGAKLYRDQAAQLPLLVDAELDDTESE